MEEHEKTPDALHVASPYSTSAVIGMPHRIPRPDCRHRSFVSRAGASGC